MHDNALANVQSSDGRFDLRLGLNPDLLLSLHLDDIRGFRRLNQQVYLTSASA